MNRIHVFFTIIMLPIIAVGCIASLPNESDTTAILTIHPTKNVTNSYTTTPKVLISTSTPNSIPPATGIRETITSTPTSALTSLTPAPTLSEEDEVILLTQLLDTNGGCDLPCWWAFTPRETNWETIFELVHSLGKVIAPSTEEKQSSAMLTLPENILISPFFAVDEDNSLYMTKVDIENYIFPEGGYVFGAPQFLQTVDRYTLPRVLKKYGEPSQILFHHRRSTIDPDPSWPDYELLLFFPDAGIMVQYEGKSAELENSFRVCPREIAMIYLWLWSPDQKLSMEEVYSVLPKYSGIPEMNLGFEQLENVTEYDSDSFFEEFQNEYSCFATPINVWK